MNDADVAALLKTGRGTMPAAPTLTSRRHEDLLDYLFDRDRPAASAADDAPAAPGVSLQRLSAAARQGELPRLQAAVGHCSTRSI